MTARRYSIEVVSPGRGQKRVEGESWVFKEGVPATYPEGKIYVTPFLDLAQAYLALQRAKAVIVTRGGILSHLAILGREFGVIVVRVDDPSILEIGDGRRISIDLDKGVVEVVG